jgi:hypothetical protein
MLRRLFVVIMLLIPLLAISSPRVAADLSPSPCDRSLFAGGIQALSSLSFGIVCDQETTVYFAICDGNSTNPPEGLTSRNLFELRDAAGRLLSYNRFKNGREYVSIGSIQLAAGIHTLTATSLNSSDLLIVGFEAVTGQDRGWVVQQLSTYCGSDFNGTYPIASSSCTVNIPVFTMDTAPSAGELRFDVQFGQLNREEGWTLQTWQVSAGQRLNAMVYAPGHHWGRLWWKPAASQTWYLLPSQYWTGDSTSRSEYGYDCRSGTAPSYHTAFNRAIPNNQVPLFSGQ